MLRLLEITNLKVVGGSQLINSNHTERNAALFVSSDIGPEGLRPKKGDMLVEFERDFPIKTMIRAVTNPRRFDYVVLEKSWE